ncbi:MAG: hypothetical protein JNM72_20940 [Deltaproteobacteria bacterium]|jgi:hypothetical protein|nr:hypothetical protein [Deltaproteobacteria bacterium]
MIDESAEGTEGPGEGLNAAQIHAAIHAEVDALVDELRKFDDEDAIKEKLRTLLLGPQGAQVREAVEGRLRGERLEVQWELEEVLEATAPKPVAPPPAPEQKKADEAPEDPKKPLTAADLVPVYDDPRGLMLHKSKKGDRWFATQFDPRTGQPQTFELMPQEITQLKTQLAGSPYWLLGGKA